MFAEDRESIMDRQIREVFDNTGKEIPSKDFAEKVMGKIESLSPCREYKPVISRQAWIGIGLLFAMLMVFFFAMAGESQEKGLLGTFLEGFDLKGLAPWIETGIAWLGAIKLSLTIKLTLLVIIATGLLEIIVHKKLTAVQH